MVEALWIKLRNFLSKKKFFTKMLITITLILAISNITVSVFLFQSLKEPTQNAIYKSQQTLLNQIRSTTDAYVFSQINSILNQNLMNIRESQELNYFFNIKNNEQKDMEQLFLVYQKLHQLTINYNFLHSIVMYNPYAKIVISSDQGITFSDIYDLEPEKAHFNLRHANDFVESGERTKWITPKDNAQYVNSSDIISYICSVPLIRTATRFYGCVVFNLHASAVTDSYHSDYEDSENSVSSIINQEGKVIASSNYDDEKDVEYSWIHALAENDSDGFFFKDKQYFLWSKSESADLLYVSVFPLNEIYNKINHSAQYTLWFTMFIILLTTFVVYWFLKWLQKPILALAAKRALMSKGEDKFADIDNIFKALSTKVTELEYALKDNKDLIKNQLMMDILNGDFSDIEDIKSRFSILGVNLTDNQHFTLLFTQINNKLVHNLDFKSKEYLFLKISEHMEDFCNNYGFYFSCRHKEYIVSLLIHNGSTYDFSTINVDENINIGICETVNDIMDLRFQFENLDLYMQYRFIYGYGNVFMYNEIELHEKNFVEMPDDFFVDMENLLNTGKIDDVKNMIHDTLSMFEMKGIRCNDVKNTLLHIVNVLCSVSRKQNFISNNLLKSNLVAEFQKTEFLHDFENWINMLLDFYQAEFEQRSKNVQEKFINDIILYIEDNITENLSLKSIAAKFAISDSHLSKVFKEIQKMNFSTFLTSKKFEHAAKMLISHKNLSVKEIAETLGYYSMPYFSQQFKQKYGMSPMHYRKTHLNPKE